MQATERRWQEEGHLRQLSVEPTQLVDRVRHTLRLAAPSQDQGALEACRQLVDPEAAQALDEPRLQLRIGKVDQVEIAEAHGLVS